jgi:hypothetical protein
MTMTSRKQLSVVAWGAAGICAFILLVSANAAVSHSVGHKTSVHEPEISPYTVSAPLVEDK